MYNNPDWNNPPSAEYPANPVGITAATGQQPKTEWQAEETDLNEPTAEVYAAAGILHNNNNNNKTSINSANNSISARSQGDNYSNNAFAITAPNSGGAIDAMNSYPYPPLNATSPYDLNVYELNPRYGQNAGENATPYLTGLQNRITGGPGNTQTRPAGPLAFGSDDNFRANYIAPPGETPDKTLDEAIIHNFADNSKAHRQRRPPTAAMQKRARAAQDETVPIDGPDEKEASFDEDENVSNKRRNEDADLEGDTDSGAPQPKKGKRRQASVSPGELIKFEAQTLDKKSRGPSIGGTARSTRENLTEEQKRSNHIQSEQKRRNLIKQGFDDLNRMVPELRSGSLSKSNMLVESARFMRLLREGNTELRSRLQGLEKG